MWQVAFSSKSVLWKTRPVSPHARRAVDERDLAEERRRSSRASCVRITSAPSPSAFTSTILPALEAELEPLDAGADPGHDQRVGRADDTLGAPPVGRREDLLGRQVRDVGDPRSPSRTSRTPTARRRAARRRDPFPGPRNRIASKRAALSASARACSVSACRRHAATGIVLVETHRRRDRVPEPLDVRLAEHHLGPARRSGRGRSPSSTSGP